MMRILFIHGRAQEEFTPTELEETWRNALQLSFSDAGLTRIPADVQMDLAYYATNLAELLDTYRNGTPDREILLRGDADETTNYNNFLDSFIQELARSAEIDFATAVREYGDPEIERGLGNNRFALSLMRALDNKFPKLANSSIKKFTEDVAAYLVVPEIASEIDRLVIEKLTGEPTIIIAHSLGTIIAYNVLNQISKDQYDVRLLITLGSPLGVKSVQRQIEGRLRHPDALQGDWHNLYDKMDFVSLNPLDEKNFNITPKIFNYLIINQSDNRHGILHYLSHPEIARIINAYSGTTGQQ